MHTFDIKRQLVSEAVGTAMLVCAVVGSGIMADNLTDDVALALLANTLATGAALVVLISILGPISGAHLNPAVTLVMVLRRAQGAVEGAWYALAQIVGGIVGTMMAHVMFSLPLLSLSTKVRDGAAQWFSEGVAAFGLVLVILAGLQFRKESVAWLVGLYIGAAYWFTASTSFANPAAAIARTFTDTITGVRPADIPGFIVAEIAGALLALGVCSWLFSDANAKSSSPIAKARSS